MSKQHYLYPKNVKFEEDNQVIFTNLDEIFFNINSQAKLPIDAGNRGCHGKAVAWILAGFSFICFLLGIYALTPNKKFFGIFSLPIALFLVALGTMAFYELWYMFRTGRRAHARYKLLLQGHIYSGVVKEIEKSVIGHKVTFALLSASDMSKLIFNTFSPRIPQVGDHLKVLYQSDNLYIIL